ncbi:hypothetical protein NM688_g2379 [Phlebia brevispora]|uniref:Uncharacterized protein n=1 Tax=Phlebia brevispora TaxID=194682 RepID=A0ACC1T8R8_9APHY|nr:hypothetical protein NM688_g2379 [Phlebia brevispora]
MTIPDPPWKQKTRPCPFYSQGRCLFADSCNFLHDVKIKVKPEDITTAVGVVPGITLTQSPTESNSSVPSRSSSLRRVRSPPRSPRLSSLLLALGDAIESDADADEDDSEEAIDEYVPSFESARAIIAASGIFGQVSRRSNVPPQRSHTLEEQKHVDIPEELSHNVTGAVSERKRDSVAAVSTSASPPEPSLKRLSGGHGLLSPIEITLAPPAFWPLGQLETVQREDSVDSGYAEWVGPTPLVRSPPRSPRTKRRMSTLDLLSSPFGTPARVISPSFMPSQASAWPASPVSSSRPVGTEDAPDDIDSSDELDSPTVHAAECKQGKAALVKDLLVKDPVVKEPPAKGLRVKDQLMTDSPMKDLLVKDPLEKDLSTKDSPAKCLLVKDQPMTDPLATDSLAKDSPAKELLVKDLTAQRSPVKDLLMKHSPPQFVLSTSPFVPGEDAAPETGVHLFEDGRHAEQIAFSEHDGIQVQLGCPAESSSHVRPPSLPPPSRRVSTRGHNEDASVFLDENASALAYLTSPERVDMPVFRVPVLSPSSSAIPVDNSMDDVHLASRQSLSLNALPSPHSPTKVADNIDVDSPDHFSVSRLVSPSVSLRSFPHSSSPVSPSIITGRTSTPDSVSDRRESRASRKVPFGFRNSMTARSRDSSASSRQTTTSHSSIRRRPPILTNITSNLFNEPESLTPSEPSSTHSRLKPLRLSLLLNSSAPGSALLSSSITPSLTTSTTAASHSPSPSVSSGYSISHNALLSSPRSSTIPDRKRNTLVMDHQQTVAQDSYHSGPLSAPLTNHFTWQKHPLAFKNNSLHDLTLNAGRSDSRFAEPITPLDEEVKENIIVEEDEEMEEATGVSAEVEECLDDEDEAELEVDDTIRVARVVQVAASASRPGSVASMIHHEPIHAIATPRPTLLFAIASDDVEEVRRVLESGEVGPNDDVGPQSALAFAVTAEQLKHRTEMVKLLLAHGANPSSLGESGRTSRSSVRSSDTGPSNIVTPDGVLAGVDAATRYYINRAEAPQMRRASALIHRSFFRPLTKVRYDMIGQDRALEQLFRVLSMPTSAPIVVLLCGPSGHGKSLLARKFGSLLDVPTHTVNMTTLRSTHDIWRSYSMNPYEPPSTCTLADFLLENEGKRCVVVLDEIEKTEDEKFLSSLLMPWELGRCSFEAGKRHVDVSKVIWLGTSNVGHDLVFEHQASRPNPEEPVSREEYIELIGLLRPKVSERLGPSVLSRVTTVLPFISFTVEEQKAIAAEALHSLTGGAVQSLPPSTVDKLVENALRNYIPAEVSNQPIAARKDDRLINLAICQNAYQPILLQWYHIRRKRPWGMRPATESSKGDAHSDHDPHAELHR